MTNLNQNIVKPIGVAIAGLGFGESVHIPALKSNPLFKPLALWHPRKERLLECSKSNQIEFKEDWESILLEKTIEAVIIATPPEPRFKLALEALAAGKHLLLENPAALNAAEVKELQKVALQKGLSVAVNFEYRAVPLFMQAKKIIEQGLIGKPWLARLDWLMSSRANPSRKWNWYSQEEKGGGVVGALGTHAYDIINWLCGPSQSISSLISTSITERPDDTNAIKKVTSEDIALSHLEVLDTNGTSIYPVQLSLSAVAQEGRGFLFEIYGSKGTLSLSSNNQQDYVHGFSLKFAPAGEKFKLINAEEEFLFSKTWTDGRIAPVGRLQNWWGESIRRKTPIIPGLLEGFSSQELCDLTKKSSKIGQKILLKN